MAGHYFNSVEDVITGKPVVGAVIEVYQAGATITGQEVTTGTYATIFSDDGITSVDQSVAADRITSDSTGFFEFWTNESSVVVEISYGGSAKRAISDVEIVGGNVSGDLTALSARVDKHDTVFGLAASALDLGTFTGATISDNTNVKSALQELETAVEAAPTDGAITASGLTMSTARLLGRTTASTGAVEEMTVGTGLSLAAGDLDLADTSVTPAAYTLASITVDQQGRLTAASSGALTQATTVTQSGTPVATSVGYLGSPQMSDQDDYTLVLNDAGGHYYHVSATPHTLTIPANASVAFPIGTVIAIVNENGAGALTLAITTDTLRWGSSTGSRTIAANGTATLLKVTATVWRLTGDGIT